MKFFYCYHVLPKEGDFRESKEKTYFLDMGLGDGVKTL